MLSAVFWLISLVMFAMVASSGPMFSSVLFPTIFSYALFSLSISVVFFSTSSFLLLISISYRWIVLAFSLSSSSRALRVSSSLELWACVLSKSTLILAISLFRLMMSISSRLICFTVFLVCCTVFCEDFSMVVWSEILFNISSSMSWISWLILTMFLSTLWISLLTFWPSLTHFCTVFSVCSSELPSFMCVSYRASFFSWLCASCFFRNSASPSSFFSTLVSCSF